MRLLVSSVGLLCVLAMLTTGNSEETGARSAAEPRLSIEVRPASLAIAGDVSSTGHEAILRQTAFNRFPGKDVVFDVTVRSAVPPGWALVTDLLLRAMASTRSSVAQVTATSVDVEGVTGDADAWSRALARVEDAKLDGMRLRYRVEEVGSPASLERQCISLFRSAARGRKLEFSQSASTIGTAAHPLLDELIQIAVDCPAGLIEITGHTDSSGDASANQALSQARADAVAHYLVAGGLPADRVSAKGVGSSAPLVENNGARARRLNRRIEIELRFP